MFIQNNVSDLVVNYHVTESCNYGCKYCYARWSRNNLKELHTDIDKTARLFQHLKQFFLSDNSDNPIQKYMHWDNVRLNFAGGEPFLIGKRFEELIELAYSYGFKISIITNGSLITEQFIKNVGDKISMIGFSIDSCNIETLRHIGRCNKREEPINFYELEKHIEILKQLNEKISIKINTVVNSLNKDEFVGPLIDIIKPDKWKLLQVLPVVNSDFNISKNDFDNFVLRHTRYKDIIVKEDNSAMTDSYIMVNPKGCFYQNSNISDDVNESYIYSEPILDVGPFSAFESIKFNAERFAYRY